MPAITARINAAVPGLNFADIDTLGGFYACAFDYAAHGVSPWCGAFTKQEIDQFEYAFPLVKSNQRDTYS